MYFPILLIFYVSNKSLQAVISGGFPLLESEEPVFGSSERFKFTLKSVSDNTDLCEELDRITNSDTMGCVIVVSDELTTSSVEAGLVPSDLTRAIRQKFQESIYLCGLVALAPGAARRILDIDRSVDTSAFNLEKLNWLNFEHLRRINDDEILKMLREEILNSDYNNDNYSDEYLVKVILAMKERVSFVKEYLTKSFYFFEVPKEYEEKNLKKRWKEDSNKLLKKLRDEFEKLNNPTIEDFETSLAKVAEELNVGKGKLIHPLRIAVSGVGEGPGVFDILNILGKNEVISRINTALSRLK